MDKLTDEVHCRCDFCGAVTPSCKRIQAQADEIEALHDQVIHMGEIMDRVANALKGVPPACTLHSTHDIAELTAAKVEEVRVLREALSYVHTTMGPQTPDCCGCKEEWSAAMDVCRKALAATEAKSDDQD